MIEPHGGQLVNRIIDERERDRVLESARELPRLVLTPDLVQEVRNICSGVYSPLTGFLRKSDYERVLSDMRLANDVVWPIPIILSIQEEEREKLRGATRVVLEDEQHKPLAVMDNPELYSFDREQLAQAVFGTLDERHPGVAATHQLGPYLVGGDLTLIERAPGMFAEYDLTPQETRELFFKRGWQTIAAFQTRNVPHRGHEYLQQEALKLTDGLLIHPVVGEKKLEDFKDEYILASYELLLDRYFSRERVALSVLPLSMRYAGPREALFHALIRKNYGCTHFIVGRDHAGVGNYYPPFAAQEIFQKFEPGEISIEILKFPEVVYLPQTDSYAFKDENLKTSDFVSFSGSRLREYIDKKESPPRYLIRPEIYNLLCHSHNPLVDKVYRQRTGSSHPGFVIWVTGLSQAGKTTIADAVHRELQARGWRTERLDGDVVREQLSADLGFSSADRDENIKRVASVAKLIARNNRGVIASFISPYRHQRELVRQELKKLEPPVTFIEVFCNCPLEVCESRDTKGLYQKARLGQIKNFTGISDPYEPPEAAELEFRTDQLSPSEAVSQILAYLEHELQLPHTTVSAPSQVAGTT